MEKKKTTSGEENSPAAPAETQTRVLLITIPVLYQQAVLAGFWFPILLGNQGSSEKAEVKRKVLREVLNCEREHLCRMWGGRLFQTRGA